MACCFTQKCWENFGNQKTVRKQEVSWVEKVFLLTPWNWQTWFWRCGRFEGINIRGANKKKRETMEALSKKTESQQGNTTTKKTCYHFRGHNYRTNSFMCNSTLACSSSHEQRIFGWFLVLTWGDEPSYIILVATPWEPQVHPLMRSLSVAGWRVSVSMYIGRLLVS